MALIDVRKEIAFCRELGIPIRGLVENMSGYKCRYCSECTNIFSRFVLRRHCVAASRDVVGASDGGRLLAAELGLPFLGVVPIDVELAACEDAGQNFFLHAPQSTTLNAVAEFAARCCDEQASISTT